MLYTRITVNTYCFFFYITFTYYIPYLFWRYNNEKERGGYAENITTTTLVYTTPATVDGSDIAGGVFPEGARGIPGMCDHTVYAADSLDEWWASPKERGGFHE